MAINYHFKATVMVDVRGTDHNMARESSTPDPQYQRVLHAHGFVEMPYPPKSQAQVVALENTVINHAKEVAKKNFNLTGETLGNSVIIIDSLNVVAEYQE